MSYSVSVQGGAIYSSVVVTKPVAPKELISDAQATPRRRQRPSSCRTELAVAYHAPLMLDLGRRRTSRGSCAKLLT